MDLRDHDLSQVIEEALIKRPEELLQCLMQRLLKDLKETHEPFEQKSHGTKLRLTKEGPWAIGQTSANSTDEIEQPEVEHTSTEFHQPTQVLANEIIKDWDFIFWVLKYRYLALTNHEA